jgi:hypothetical protein
MTFSCLDYAFTISQYKNTYSLQWTGVESNEVFERTVVEVLSVRPVVKALTNWKSVLRGVRRPQTAVAS